MPHSSSSRSDVTGVVPVQVELLERDAPARGEVEAFIHAHYATAYGADVRHFLPHLMVLRGDNQELLAALGFCSAYRSPLFLERYLNDSVEAALSGKLRRALVRSGLVEVGNLVTAHAGGARWLIAALTAYLQAVGSDWAVFTAVRELRNAFARLGVGLVPLARADGERLHPDERGQWGEYYRADPMVVAAGVPQSFAALEHFFDFELDRYCIKPIWTGAYEACATMRAA